MIPFEDDDACSGSGSIGADHPGGRRCPSPRTARRRVADSPVNLTYYYGGNGAPADLALVQNAMNAILIKKINATVTLNEVDWGTYESEDEPHFLLGPALRSGLYRAMD